MTDIENTLRTFNIDRPDIQEAIKHGASKIIAVPVYRHKQYYDTIKAQQAEIKALKDAAHNTEFKIAAAIRMAKKHPELTAYEMLRVILTEVRK